MGNVEGLVALLLLGTLIGPSSTADRAPVAGAYERLSPASQRIACALYEEQTINLARVVPKTLSASRSVTARPLTLEEIAVRSHSGRNWGQVFLDMQSLGLVRAKHLDEVMSHARLREEHLRRSARGPGDDRTASTR